MNMYAPIVSGRRGIQRLAFEVYRELQARHGSTGLVHFVRHSLTGNNFEVVTMVRGRRAVCRPGDQQGGAGDACCGRADIPAFARPPTHSPAGIPVAAVTACPNRRCGVDASEGLALLGQAARSADARDGTTSAQARAAFSWAQGRQLACPTGIQPPLRGPCRARRHPADARRHVVASGLSRV